VEINAFTIDSTTGARFSLLEDKATTTELTFTYKVEPSQVKLLPIMPANYLESLAYLKARSDILTI
jgi:hypothetical protein